MVSQGDPLSMSVSETFPDSFLPPRLRTHLGVTHHLFIYYSFIVIC